MGIQVVIQPSNRSGAEVETIFPGVRQLVAQVGEASFVIEVPARVGGLADTARFTRSLADAATQLADWCEKQEQSRTFPLNLHQSDSSDDH